MASNVAASIADGGLMSIERIEEKIDKLTEQSRLQGLDIRGISTKMDILVGPDGTNGELSDIKSRVRTVEKHQNYITGMFGLLGLLIGSALKYAWHLLFG